MFYNLRAWFDKRTSVCGTSENCKSLVLQDKCNIEIFLSPEDVLPALKIFALAASLFY